MKRLLFALVLLLAATFSNAQVAPTYYYVATTVDVNNLESIFSNEASATLVQGKHIVSLTWTAPTIPVGGAAIAGYNVYRGTVKGGPYAKISTTLVTGVTYSDTIGTLPNAPPGLTATVP